MRGHSSTHVALEEAGRQHCDALFLSAHLDDAVLSCSLRILEEIKAGHRVKVATLFSAACPRLFGVDFYCGRRSEDANALNLLGVRDPIWLGFPDAIFRGPGYWSFLKITTGEHVENRRFFDQVASRVCSLYEKCNPETIFLPLAVGTHIDHRCTFAIWEKLPSRANIVFYEDRPYSFVPHSVLLRLQDIGGGTEETQNADIGDGGKVLDTWGEALGDRDKVLADLMDGLSTVTMYKNVLKNERKRLQYALYLARGAASGGLRPAPGVLSTASGVLREQKPAAKKGFMQLKAEVVDTKSRNDLEQIVKANAAYVSQIGMLYDKMKIFRDESDSYTRTLDPSALYAERYWRLVR